MLNIECNKTNVWTILDIYYTMPNKWNPTCPNMYPGQA